MWEFVDYVHGPCPDGTYCFEPGYPGTYQGQIAYTDCQTPQAMPPLMQTAAGPEEQATGDASPGLGMAPRYLSAVARWTAAGFPTRSDEEVERIYALCAECPWKHEDGYCRRCGCWLNKSQHAMANKIRMATEHCPLPTPKW